MCSLTARSAVGNMRAFHLFSYWPNLKTHPLWDGRCASSGNAEWSHIAPTSKELSLEGRPARFAAFTEALRVGALC